MSRKFWLVVLMLVWARANAQEIYTADLTKAHAPVLTNHLKLGTHVDPAGQALVPCNGRISFFALFPQPMGRVGFKDESCRH
jgi:hypothetical protein